MKKLVLASGGLDSTTLLLELARHNKNTNIKALYYHYNQTNKYEIECLRKITKDLNIKLLEYDISFFGEIIKNNCNIVEDGKNGLLYEIPYKNAVFISIALPIAQSEDCDAIYMGLIKSDSIMWDARDDYFSTLNKLSKDIEIRLPFKNDSKDVIYQKFIKSFQMNIKDISSCFFQKDDKPCGKCSACLCNDNLVSRYQGYVS